MLTLRELPREATELSAAFDASLLDERGARAAVEHPARLEKIAASLEARAAGRIAETGSYRRSGRGKRPMVPPDDRRHPRHGHRSREGPASPEAA